MITILLNLLILEQGELVRQLKYPENWLANTVAEVMAVTEKRQRGAKHELTPGSKQHPSQPKSKRFLVGMSIFLTCSFEDLSCIIVFLVFIAFGVSTPIHL